MRAAKRVRDLLWLLIRTFRILHLIRNDRTGFINGFGKGQGISRAARRGKGWRDLSP
jgi:hypothetical protein